MENIDSHRQTRAALLLAASMWLCGALVPGAASAEGPAVDRGSEGPVEGETASVWYGWQSLSVDGASILVGLGGLAAEDPGLAAFGLGGLVLGAPAVHVAHGNPWALASLGLRLGSVALTIVGFNACQHWDGSGEDRSGCGLIWAWLGVPAAIALDGALWSRERVAIPATASSTPAVRPYLDHRRAGAGVIASWAL